jgi:phosphatidylglycerol:prolipoprotein diacylglycerol transferase
LKPVLFDLPLLGLPVRMFGLYIIAAFFIATLWAQWQLTRLRKPEVADNRRISSLMKMMLWGTVISRVVFIALPGVSWGASVTVVLLIDLALGGVVWFNWLDIQKKHGREESDFVFNLGFWLLIIGFLGARIFWVLTTDDGRAKFVDSPARALFAVWEGGIVWYGGLICSSLFCIWYLWWKNENVMEHGDIYMTGIALALFIGRWSCFSAGDDFGRPTDVAWGVIFPQVPETQIPKEYWDHTPLHPAQLYMSLNGLIDFVICAWILRRKRFHGQVVYAYLMLYAVGRSIIEIYRGDETRGLYDVAGMDLSSSQIISVPVFLFAAFLFARGWVKSRNGKMGDSPPPEPVAEG